MARGPGGAARVHGGPRRCGQDGAAAPFQRTGARARWCSPAAAEEDKLGVVVQEGRSPEYELRWRARHEGGKEWRRVELGMRAKEGARELGRVGKKGR
jgi:hypothetical protein